MDIEDEIERCEAKGIGKPLEARRELAADLLSRVESRIQQLERDIDHVRRGVMRGLWSEGRDEEMALSDMRADQAELDRLRTWIDTTEWWCHGCSLCQSEEHHAPHIVPDRFVRHICPGVGPRAGRCSHVGSPMPDDFTRFQGRMPEGWTFS